MKKKKQVVWAVILLMIIVLFFLTGCKPKQVIIEKVVAVTDSSAVMALRVELEKRNKEIKDFKVEVRRLRDENVRLEQENSTHTIVYDTGGALKPDGSYPKASETMSGSKSKIDKVVKEYEESKAEYRRVIESLEKKNSNLESEVALVKSENKELKAKIVPTTGFNFRLVIISLIIGFIIGITLRWKIGKFKNY